MSLKNDVIFEHEINSNYLAYIFNRSGFQALNSKNNRFDFFTDNHMFVCDIDNEQENLIFSASRGRDTQEWEKLFQFINRENLLPAPFPNILFHLKEYDDYEILDLHASTALTYKKGIIASHIIAQATGFVGAMEYIDTKLKSL